MKIVKVIVGKGTDLYSAYSDDAPGIWGEGATVAETKQSFMNAIALFAEYNEPEKVPTTLKGEYYLEWKFEIEA